MQCIKENVLTDNLRLAQLRGSGKAKRLWAKARVAPIVSSANVRNTDIF